MEIKFYAISPRLQFLRIRKNNYKKYKTIQIDEQVDMTFRVIK